MDENKVLRDSMAKMQKDREIQNEKRLESVVAHSKEIMSKTSAPNNSMDGSQALIDCLRQIDQEKQIRKAEGLESELAHVKKIIDNPFTIDNSMEGAVCLVKGSRRSIYQKGNYFFLGAANGTIDKLYAPTKDRAEIERLFEEANLDDID